MCVSWNNSYSLEGLAGTSVFLIFLSDIREKQLLPQNEMGHSPLLSYSHHPCIMSQDIEEVLDLGVFYMK